MTTVTKETEDKRPIIIYAMPGSQFTAKVLAGMQSRDIDHYVQFVPLKPDQRREELPSGGTMVPEMLVGKRGPDATIVAGSETILEWLTEHKQAAQFYPVVPDCSDVSKRASDEKLAGLVWYYNWANEEGFRSSMLKSIPQAIPSYLAWLVPNFVVGKSLTSIRVKYRALAAEAIGVEDSELDNADAMKKILVDELVFFQSLLTGDHEQQKYLIPGTNQPTAADFSVYAQMERLVGEGTASDVVVFPAIQWFKEEAKKDHGLTRLMEWYDHMRATCPVQFKNKRAPADLLAAPESS